MTLVPHTGSGTPSTATSSPSSSHPPLHRPLNVRKINLVAAGDHDVIRPAEDHQLSGLPAAAILGAKPAVHHSFSGEVWTQPIASEERRTPDQDPTVVGEFNSDTLQWLSVTNTAAAGLAHAVGDDDVDPGVGRHAPPNRGSRAPHRPGQH